jgi:predicted DNA-binding mobile mystery protein A
VPESTRNLRRSQLNETLSRFDGLEPFPVPRSGWAKAIREGLGMTHGQVAARLKISRQSVQDLEAAEAKRRITLASLERLAGAMGCRLVYALVPERGSLDAVLERQAQSVAAAMLARAGHSMKLEGQGVSSRERDAQLERLKDSLLRGSPRKLWK